MPTVLRIGGLRVLVRTNDHPPPHVHVEDGMKRNDAKFELNRLGGSVVLKENRGFSDHETRKIARELLPHLNMLLNAWENIHGSA